MVTGEPRSEELPERWSAKAKFTALYRQDKRVRLVRYAGEGRTISGRANVLDMWRRIQEWIRETMPSSPQTLAHAWIQWQLLDVITMPARFPRD